MHVVRFGILLKEVQRLQVISPAVVSFNNPTTTPLSPSYGSSAPGVDSVHRSTVRRSRRCGQRFGRPHIQLGECNERALPQRYARPPLSRLVLLGKLAIRALTRLTHVLIEASLEKLDLVADRLDEEIVTCRNHIKAAEAEAQSSANAGSQELAEVQGTLGELFTQIHHLKSGATESQSVVKDITRDIKTLDTAKTNITTSMTAVKRFQMLLNGFDQLSRLAKAKKYRETAQSLLVSSLTLREPRVPLTQDQGKPRS